MEKEKEILFAINDCLEKQGLSKSIFAKELGCSVRLVHYWLKGERGISIDMAHKALGILGITMEIGNKKRDG